VGATLSDVQAVSIKVPVAAAYGLPAPLVLEPLIKDEKLDVVSLGVSPDNLKLYVPPGQYEDGKLPKYIYVDVVSEVYYARVLDVETSFKSSYGARVGLSLPGTGLSQQQGPAAELSSTTRPNSPADSQGSAARETGTSGLAKAQGATEAARAAADAVSSELDRLAQRDRLPGATVSVKAAGVGGVSLRRSYMKPVGIGYRGVRLKVELETRLIVGAAEIDIGTKSYNQGR
jgi:hypothetical protein